jgi:hypothetical protein
MIKVALIAVYQSIMTIVYYQYENKQAYTQRCVFKNKAISSKFIIANVITCWTKQDAKICNAPTNNALAYVIPSTHNVLMTHPETLPIAPDS